jgi:hypothetical protein
MFTAYGDHGRGQDTESAVALVTKKKKKNPRICLEKLKKPGKMSVRITGAPIEIRTERLSKLYSVNELTG